MPKYFLTARSEEITVEPLVMPKIGFEVGDLVEIEFEDERRVGRIEKKRERTVPTGLSVYSVEFPWRGRVRLAWFTEDEILPLNVVDELARLGRTIP